MLLNAATSGASGSEARGERDQQARRPIVLLDHARQLHLETDDAPHRHAGNHGRAVRSAEELAGPQAVVDQPVGDARLGEHAPDEVRVVRALACLQHRIDRGGAAVESGQIADAAAEVEMCHDRSGPAAPGRWPR